MKASCAPWFFYNTCICYFLFVSGAFSFSFADVVFILFTFFGKIQARLLTVVYVVILTPFFGLPSLSSLMKVLLALSGTHFVNFSECIQFTVKCGCRRRKGCLEFFRNCAWVLPSPRATFQHCYCTCQSNVFAQGWCLF